MNASALFDPLCNFHGIGWARMKEVRKELRQGGSTKLIVDKAVAIRKFGGSSREKSGPPERTLPCLTQIL